MGNASCSFYEKCQKMLNDKGFHVASEQDALYCIAQLCELVNTAEIAEYVREGHTYGNIQTGD
jgi:hypothetical protein